MSLPSRYPIALATLCIVVSGCGGENPRGISRRQLVKRSQAICLHAQSAAGAILPPSRRAGLAGTAGYFARSAVIARAKTDELRAIKPKPGSRLALRWSRLLAAEEGFTARLESLAAAAAAHDTRRLGLAEADTAPEQKLIAHAKRLGVPLCAP